MGNFTVGGFSNRSHTVPYTFLNNENQSFLDVCIPSLAIVYARLAHQVHLGGDRIDPDFNVY